MTDQTNSDQQNNSVTLTPEELAKLKEGYVEFCNRIVGAKDIVDTMTKALNEGEHDLVVEKWQPLKLELNHLNNMAIQLNVGDYSALVRQQLESLLEATNEIYQKVLDTESPSADIAQKATNAYREN